METAKKKRYAKPWEKKLTPEQSRLAANYLPLALKVAKRYERRGEHRWNDAVHDAVVPALMDAAWSYRPEGGCAFKSWVSQKVVFAIRDVARAPDRTTCPPPSEFRAAAHPETPEWEHEEHFNHLIRDLPASHARIMKLIFLDGKLHKEAAEVVGLSPSRVSYIVTESFAALKGSKEFA